MSWLGSLLGGGGSTSQSTSTSANITADMRTAMGDVSGQVATPGSVIANPLSQGIVTSGQSQVKQTFAGPVNLGMGAGEVSSLVNTLASQETETVKTLAELQATSSQGAQSTIGALTDVVAAAKGEGSTATRWLPWAAVAAVLVLAFLWRQK